jgi:thioredoxin 1
MEIKGTSTNFVEEVLNSNIPVLVDFWATWCGPCMMLAPILKNIAEKYAGKVKVVKINVDEEYELSKNFGIMSIPTLMLFNNGEMVKKTLGYMEQPAVEEFIKL